MLLDKFLVVTVIMLVLFKVMKNGYDFEIMFN